MKNKVVAFVPIKLSNQRLPGKNLKQFDDGTPLMEVILHSLLEVKGMGMIDEVYVYCSDDSITQYLPNGIRFLKRPSYLDGSEIVGRKIYEQFVNTIEADIYVLAHATSPFVSVEHIAKCVERVKSGDYDSAFCAKKLQTFLWKDGRPFNFDASNPPRTQDIAPIYYELSTPYVFSSETFKTYCARTGVNPYICECSEIECIDIDYLDDFVLANAIYMRFFSSVMEGTHE